MIKEITKFKDKNIEEIFNAYPKEVKEKLLSIREMIFEVSMQTKAIWSIEETLKWWEPSYVSKIWCTVRIDKVHWSDTDFSVFFNCKTTLISTFKEIFWNQFNYSWNRALIFNINDTIDTDNLKHCIYLSLTYFQK